MSVISLELADAEMARLAEVAARDGVTLEEAAAAAVKARLEADAASVREIEAGLAELDAGAGMTLDDYERELDAFLSQLQATHA